jgi:hypothetical protein
LKKRWRQRQTVVWFTPIPASTIFLTERWSVMWDRYWPHFSGLRARAIGVPVRMLKLR